MILCFKGSISSIGILHTMLQGNQFIGVDPHRSQDAEGLG